jgi:uncharacterized protein (TIGR03083 family)
VGPTATPPLIDPRETPRVIRPTTEADRRLLVADLAASDAFIAEAHAVAPDAPVPACPGWDVAALVQHLTRLQTNIAELVRSRAPERPPSTPRFEPHELDGAFRSAGTALADALAAVPLDAPVWTFDGSGHAEFWVRRMAVEAAVHALDAAAAIGREREVDPAVAAIALEDDARFFLRLAHSRRDPATPPRGSLHLHRTDGEGEWLLVDGPDGPVVTHEHAKGDAAVRARAPELLAFLWHRLDPAELAHFGDLAVARSWAITI